MNLGADTAAETRAFNERLAQLQAEQPAIETVPVEVTRSEPGLLPPPVFLEQARWLEIPSRGGGLRVRVLEPEGEARGAFLHLHGGGWVIGAADRQDPLLEAVAEVTGLCAVSVEYRLAPEHPYPAGPDDCEDAALWLLERGAAELGVPPRFAIGGESAGAQLAVVTLVRLRDRHGIAGAFAAANLVFGAFDLAGTPSRRLWGDRQLLLTSPSLTWFAECFAGARDAEALRDPDLSPLYADLRDLPPALFTVGTADPLLDDSLFMAARWEAAGNRAELRVYEEGCHAFTAFPLAVAKLANEAQLGFLREAV
ncbi:MAG TPA: alpha/beta hydrolase [Gaiellaceae bacterium]|jgi:acetyl esterase/lipase|nr:alpha/beta hydrolase [Gaiellaceae bacterium]